MTSAPINPTKPPNSSTTTFTPLLSLSNVVNSLSIFIISGIYSTGSHNSVIRAVLFFLIIAVSNFSLFATPCILSTLSPRTTHQGEVFETINSEMLSRVSQPFMLGAEAILSVLAGWWKK